MLQFGVVVVCDYDLKFLICHLLLKELLYKNIYYQLYSLMQSNYLMQSRGPNTLNLNSYTRGPEKASSSSPYTQTQNITIQEKFDNYVRQIRQHEEVMTKMAKNISSLTQDNDFITDFYPNYPLNCKYDKGEEKKAVFYSDPSLHKILSSLQRTNSSLKEEIKGWNFEFAKKTRLVQTLISQNKILRRYLSKKNKQIISLLEHIKQTENTELNDLNFVLDQLKEQNNILADHQKRIKQDLESKKNEEIQVSKAIDEANRKKLELEAKMIQIEDREQHIGKSSVMNSGNEKQYMMREKYLLAEKDRLTKLKLEYTKDRSDIKFEMDQCQIDKKDIQSNLQEKFEYHRNQKNQLSEEIESSYQIYREQIALNNKKKDQILSYQNKLSEYYTLNRKLERKYKDYKKENDQKQSELSQLIKQQGSVQADMDLLDLEINELKQLVQTKKKQAEQMNAKYDSEMKTMISLKQEEVNRWKKQLEIAKRSSQKRILEQKNQLDLQAKQIHSLQQQIPQINGYIQSLLEEIRQNKQKQLSTQQSRGRLGIIQSQQQIRR